jgi:hypothetical protein
MTLPNFQLFLIKLRGDKGISPTEVMPRLTQVLAWIYNDILDFCHRICTLLYPQQKGEHAMLLWKVKTWDLMSTCRCQI